MPEAPKKKKAMKRNDELEERKAKRVTLGRVGAGNGKQKNGGRT